MTTLFDLQGCAQEVRGNYWLLEKEAPRCVAALTLNLLELISTNSFVLRALIWSQCGSKGGARLGQPNPLIFRNVINEAPSPDV